MPLTCAPPAYHRFAAFATAMLASRDAGPFHPVLRHLQRDLALESALWLTFLFLAFDHLGSAWQAFRRHPLPAPLAPELYRLPLYVDRRGLRGGRMAQHVQALLTAMAPAGSLAQWIRQDWGRDPLANYAVFWDRAQTLWGNGRWAAFKWTEFLKHVHGFPLTAPDMQLQGALWAVEGLARLYRVPVTWPTAADDQLGYDLMVRLQADRVTLDWETLEKLLCNWHSLHHGRYYVGYDIDAMHDEIWTVPWPSDRRRLFAARRAALPRWALGEVCGWGGVRTARLTAYRDRRVLDGAA